MVKFNMLKKFKAISKVLGKLNIRFAQPVTDIQILFLGSNETSNRCPPSSGDSIHVIVLNGTGKNEKRAESIYITVDDKQDAVTKQCLYNDNDARKNINQENHFNSEIKVDQKDLELKFQRSFEEEMEEIKEILHRQHSLSSSVLNKEELRALDNVCDESQIIENFEKKEEESNCSTMSTVQRFLSKNALDFKNELEKKIALLESECVEKRKQLQKDVPDNIFIELMTATKHDLQRSKNFLWNRYQAEKQTLKNDLDQKNITKNIYEKNIDELQQDFKKPYAKVNQDLHKIRKEIQGQIHDIKKDLRCEIKTIEQQIVNLRHKIISNNFIEHDKMYAQFCKIKNY